MSRVPYQRCARWYDTLIEPFNKGLRQIGLEMCPPSQGMRVLDVGCGTGTHLDLYQLGGCQVFGIDSSKAMLDMARQKLGQRATLHLGNAAEMPYEDKFFDLILITLVLHEMPNTVRSAVVREIKRIVKPGGQILVIDYYNGPVRFPKGWLFKGIITLIERFAGVEHFKNYRDFLATGCVPALADKHNLARAQEKIVTGGNLGLFVVQVD